MKKINLSGIFISVMFNVGFNPVYSDVAAPVLKGPCEKELETYCSNVKPGKGQMMECLKRYDKYLSHDCKEYLTTWSTELKQLQQSCGDDTFEYCSTVRVSYKRILQCLKEHINEISHDCRVLLQKK